MSGTASRPSPPARHQLALMNWLAVFPMLTVINVLLGDWLGTLPAMLRTFVLATVAVPIVIYGLIPPGLGCAPGCWPGSCRFTIRNHHMW